MVAAGASWVERGNFHFNVVVTPFLVAALFVLSRRARPVAMALLVVVILLAEPFRHVLTVVPELHAATTLPLFDETSDRSIRAARRFAATLPPGDTFVDFTNSAIVYSLTGRDCPLRYVEVANYQPEAMQRQVIAAIQRNPRVRAALIAFPGTNPDVDGVPNQQRAPLVWDYLQRNFTPSWSEDGVVFWKRRVQTSQDD